MSKAKVKIYACQVAECDYISGGKGNVLLHVRRAHGIPSVEVRTIGLSVTLQRDVNDDIQVIEHD